MVGFAAETNDLVDNATRKLNAKHADFIVGNLIGRKEGAFGRDDNKVVVISHDNEPIEIGPMDKSELATALLGLFTPRLNAVLTKDNAQPE